MSRNNLVYQVSDLTNEMRRLMETSYPEIWIEGELSSLSTPASGHLYFSLKDERSQLRCAMFKGRASINRYRPKAGDLVRVRAKISVYTARGDLQCIVQYIEEAGEGLLQRRFEELKAELQRQGLFEHKYKRTIPPFPKHIGLITSPSGAAVRDVISTLGRRCPGIPVTVYPAVVQGDTAATSLIEAIRDAVKHQKADVIILSRGGGSLEDLWCFNHDELAKTIFECPIPIVSGVGHEVDITIADLVADVRAPTPTAAAELVSPDVDQLIAQLNSLQLRLPNTKRRMLQNLAQQVDMTSKQLRHPRQSLQIKANDLKQSAGRLEHAMQQRIKWQRSAFGRLQHGLLGNQPSKKLKLAHQSLQQTQQRVFQANARALSAANSKISSISGQLNTVSPLATIERGFSIARDEHQQIVRATHAVTKGDAISLQVTDGNIDCEVVKVRVID